MKVMELYKALNIPDSEYEKIKEGLNREPSELETYLFSAMWSEHCGYNHSKNYLEKLPQVGSIGADENAGGVQIGDHVIVFKVESHNHPSAIEPFQGAATGIGGIIRDVIAVGARPIALLDSLKFGVLKDPNVKHLFDGVVNGISAYGNSIGVPTVAGEVAFDESYTFSPLVNVMAVGIVKKDDIKTSKARSGGLVVLVGSHTGRDGIHGASFASKELSDKSKEDRPSVQVGDPFMEKIVIEANLEILKLAEIICCQDCGAAGLLSSTSEMAHKGKCGLELHLDQVHLREEGMEPWEIMLSESQERMVYVIDPSGLDKVMNIAKKYDIPAAVIGKTTDDGLYRLCWHGEEMACLPPHLLGDAPRYAINEDEPAYISEYREKILGASHCHRLPSLPHEKTLEVKTSVEEGVKKLITDPNFASKKWIYRQYDHTVGDRTSVRPGMAGAAGIWLYEEGGVIGLTIDSNGRQVFLDPYKGTKNTVWEAYRNLVSGGFEPIGITNCLNYGNPEKDEVGYQFSSSIKGMSEACLEAKIPVVSGNVSFYNESPAQRVYPTPAIGMVGYTDKPEKLIKNSFTQGETVILIGKQIDDSSDVGGSLYQMVFYDFLGGKVDQIDTKLEKQLKNAIFDLRDKNLLCGCIDVSEGGLFGALFEALKSRGTGFKGNLINGKDLEKALFGEITGRYIISVKEVEAVKSLLSAGNIPFKELGLCIAGNWNEFAASRSAKPPFSLLTPASHMFEFDGYKFDIDKLANSYDKAIELEMQQ